MSPPVSPLGAYHRSPLGAFYRTPLGCFGPGGGAPPLATWEVTSVDFDEPDGDGLDTACNFGQEGVTYYGTRFSVTTGSTVPRATSNDHIRFTGGTSGATYDWIGPASCVNAIFGVGDANVLNYPAYTFRPYDIWILDPTFTDYEGFAFYSDAPGSPFILGEPIYLTVVTP